MNAKNLLIFTSGVITGVMLLFCSELQHQRKQQMSTTSVPFHVNLTNDLTWMVNHGFRTIWIDNTNQPISAYKYQGSWHVKIGDVNLVWVDDDCKHTNQ